MNQIRNSIIAKKDLYEIRSGQHAEKTIFLDRRLQLLENLSIVIRSNKHIKKKKQTLS